MKKVLIFGIAAIFVMFFCVSTSAMGADIELAKKSTLELILKKGELRVGFEAGYMPFEMTDKKGKFVGFDIDMAKAMAKAKIALRRMRTKKAIAQRAATPSGSADKKPDPS